MSWYHEYFLHPGQTRPEKTFKNTMKWTDLKQDVEHWKLIVYVPIVNYNVTYPDFMSHIILRSNVRIS
jgi:hypothetical protein